MLSGCCVHCQQPVKMLRLKSGTPSLRGRERERESVCVCVRLYMCSSFCEKAFEWVLCCLDVASIVNSLSRCSVLSQVPRVYERERERVCVYVCMCVAVCVRKPWSGSCVVWMLRPLSTACQDAPS